MVRHDRRRAVAPVDGVDLRHVLEDRDELDSLPCARRGERREVAQRRDVRALVEDEQERRVERLAGLGRAVVGARDDLLDEGREQRLEAALLVRRSAEVGGVAAAVEKPLGVGARASAPTRGRPDRRRRRARSRRSCRRSTRVSSSRSDDRLERVDCRRLAARARAPIGPLPSSCASTQRTTSAIVPPLCAAAKRIGARSFAAAAYQNSALSIAGATAAAPPRTSQSATRCAPCQVAQPASGVQPALGMPVPAGRVVDPDVRVRGSPTARRASRAGDRS